MIRGGSPLVQRGLESWALIYLVGGWWSVVEPGPSRAEDELRLQGTVDGFGVEHGGHGVAVRGGCVLRGSPKTVLQTPLAVTFQPVKENNP